MWWHMNTRVAGIKFKPKREKSDRRTDEMIGQLEELSGSLIITELTKFIGSFFENLFISKEVS